MDRAVDIGHGAGNAGAQPGMELPGSGEAGDLLDVGLPNSAADHDIDPRASVSNEAGQAIRSQFCGRLSAGSKEAMGAGSDDLLERFVEIARHVDGAVKGDLH